jgi:drug/metabolite transporter (DMT)-like permease
MDLGGNSLLHHQLYLLVEGTKVLPLNIAFNLVNIEHVFVPLASYLFLGEMISPMRAAGIAVVLLGVLVIAESYCRVEERA